MELESELLAANSEIDSLRDQLDHPDRTKENELYSLDRRATLSETKNKGEMPLALGLQAIATVLR